MPSSSSFENWMPEFCRRPTDSSAYMSSVRLNLKLNCQVETPVSGRLPLSSKKVKPSWIIFSKSTLHLSWKKNKRMVNPLLFCLLSVGGGDREGCDSDLNSRTHQFSRVFGAQIWLLTQNRTMHLKSEQYWLNFATKGLWNQKLFGSVNTRAFWKKTQAFWLQHLAVRKWPTTANYQKKTSLDICF